MKASISGFIIFLALHLSQYAIGQPSPDSLQSQIHTLQDSVKKYRSEQLVDIQTIKLLKETREIASSPQTLLLKGGLWLVAFAFLFWLAWRFLNLVQPKWFTVLIQKLVEKYEEVNQLKSKKKILVVSSSKANNITFITALLKEFNVSETIIVDNIWVEPKGSYDIVFANYESGEKDQQVLHKYILEKSKVLFYFGPPGTWDFKLDVELAKRVSLANARAQVYGNLISALKYHDQIVPELPL